MVLSNLDVIAIVIYLVVVAVIGFTSLKNLSADSFLIGSRNIDALHIASSLCAGFIGGGYLVLFIGIAYLYGLGALWLSLGQATGLVLFAVFGKKIKEEADTKKFYTLSDYFYARFDKKTGLTASVLIFLLFAGFIVIQFIAGGRIISGVTGWTYASSVIIIGLCVLVYLTLGGFKTEVTTDFFQYIVLLTLISGIGLLAFFTNNLTVSIFASLFSIGAAKIIAFLIFGAFFVIIGADVWQRAIAAKSLRAMQQGFFLAAFLIVVIGIFGSFIGIAAQSLITSGNPGDAILMSLTSLLPSGFRGLGIIIVFAAVLSTADTLVFIAAMSGMHDILSKVRQFTKEALVRYMRFAILGIGIFSIVLAIFITSIVDYAFLLTSVVLVLAPVIIWSYFGNLKKKAAFLALIISPLVIAGFALLTSIKEELSLISLVVTMVVLVVGQVLLKG